mmetsp:Transcript_81758/g.136674  ORF Transcript_81758/g.136674 Transcript_81758/m.136674 type:complete len:239 (+) Transcript_81758:164-880(+)
MDRHPIIRSPATCNLPPRTHTEKKTDDALQCLHRNGCVALSLCYPSHRGGTASPVVFVSPQVGILCVDGTRTLAGHDVSGWNGLLTRYGAGLQLRWWTLKAGPFPEPHPMARLFFHAAPRQRTGLLLPLLAVVLVTGESHLSSFQIDPSCRGWVWLVRQQFLQSSQEEFHGIVFAWRDVEPGMSADRDVRMEHRCCESNPWDFVLVFAEHNLDVENALLIDRAFRPKDRNIPHKCVVL